MRLYAQCSCGECRPSALAVNVLALAKDLTLLIPADERNAPRRPRRAPRGRRKRRAAEVNARSASRTLPARQAPRHSSIAPKCQEPPQRRASVRTAKGSSRRRRRGRDERLYSQGIDGFLDHVVLPDFQRYQQVVREKTDEDVRLIQREGDKPPKKANADPFEFHRSRWNPGRRLRHHP